MPARARVLVTTYNQVPALRLALRGYLRQTTRDFALTVADDGSRPDTGEAVRAFASEAARLGIVVDHVWQEDVGFRRARVLNEGVRHAAGEPLLVFTDGDCIPPATFVERHLAAHGPRSFHVAGRVCLGPDASAALTEADVDSGRFEGLVTDDDRADLAERARKSRWGTLLRLRHRPKVLGANVAMDRALFEELNGFDERFEGWGLEDSDLRDRAMRTRPRPPVRVLYGQNDVFHLWHPERKGAVSANRPYYESRRPVRCERGLASA